MKVTSQMTKRFALRLVAALGAIAFIIFAANYQGVPVRSSLQAEYEKWLSEREEQFRLSPASFESGPVINLHVLSVSSLHPLSVYLRSSSRAESERVFRILELMREANLFSTSRWRGSETSWPGISFFVEDGGRIFRTQLDETEVEASVQAKTMLKLLQIFAATPLPSPSPLSMALEGLETDSSAEAQAGEQ